MIKKTILLLLGLILIFAGIMGMFIFSVAIWIGVTDPKEMELAVRICAIIFILVCDAACFALTCIGWKCIVGFKKKSTKVSASVPQLNVQKRRLRCPECGVSLYGGGGEKIQCIYCGKKFTVDL